MSNEMRRGRQHDTNNYSQVPTCLVVTWSSFSGIVTATIAFPPEAIGFVWYCLYTAPIQQSATKMAVTTNVEGVTSTPLRMSKNLHE
jgi:hypothetical protein